MVHLLVDQKVEKWASQTAVQRVATLADQWGAHWADWMAANSAPQLAEQWAGQMDVRSDEKMVLLTSLLAMQLEALCLP